LIPKVLLVFGSWFGGGSGQALRHSSICIWQDLETRIGTHPSRADATTKKKRMNRLIVLLEFQLGGALHEAFEDRGERAKLSVFGDAAGLIHI
jgi:hypothetical protein